MERPRLVGTGWALLSAESFGVVPVLAKVAYDDGADVLGLLSVRFTLAAVVLLALAAARGERLPRGRTLLALVLLGGVGYTLESYGSFLALERISAGLTALLFHVYPALVVVLSAVVLRMPPRRPAVVCVVLATVGTALTIGPIQGGQLSGVLLALGAALTYAVFIVLSSRVTGVGPFATAAVLMASCAAVYDGFALGAGVDLPSGRAGRSALLAVAVVGTVVAVTAFFAALPLLGPTDTAVVSTVEPVVTIAVAAVVLGERLGPVQVAGGVLVLAAVVVLARLEPAARPETVPV